MRSLAPRRSGLIHSDREPALVDPAKDWVAFGKADPYFGVLSAAANRASVLDDGARDAFYRSGREHVGRVLEIVRQVFGYVPDGEALDFGCGVGRLTLALAPYFRRVTGLDIAPGMLATARQEAAGHGIDNVAFRLSDSVDAIETCAYDFVHTYIVLQHMRRRDGERAVARMVDGLKVGGVGALHMPYGHAGGWLTYARREWPKRNALTRALGNVALGRRWNNPTMLMTAYSLPRIFGILGRRGIEKSYVHRVDDWGYLGAFVFFRKGPDARSEFSNPIRA